MNWKPKIVYTELNTGIVKEVNFDTPPEGDPLGEEYKANNIVTTSNNGTEQVQFNYNEKLLNLKFIFQSQAVKNAMIDLINNHGARGGKIDYYPSNDELDYETYSINSKSFKLDRPIPNGSGDFEYDFSLKLRRVL